MKRLRLLAAMSVVGALTLNGVALADNIQNEISVSGGNPSTTVTSGGPGAVVDYWVHPTGGGCDYSPLNTLTFDVVVPSGVTVSPSSLTFSGCGSATSNNQPVQFTSSTPGVYAIAVDQTSTNAAANENSAKFTLRVVPRPPEGLTATGGNTTVKLDWSLSPDDTATKIDGYRVYQVGVASPIQTVGRSTTTYTHASRTNGTSYCYTVSAFKGSGDTLVESAKTSQACATPSAGVVIPTNTAPTVTIQNKPTSSVEGNTTGGANVSWGPVTAADAEDDPDPTASCASGTTPVTSGAFFALGGPYTVICTATDNDGLSGSDSFTFSVVDTTAPTLSNMPGNITKTATSASGAVATYTDPTASDVVDSAPTVACSPASGSTFAPGSTTVSCTGEDASGNKSSASTFTVTVTFAFEGFFQPIDGNIRNSMKSGSTAPMKFRVTDGGSGFISDLSIVQSTSGVRTTCSSGPAEDALEEYATGGTSLRYDPTANQFVYNWQSPKGKAGSCYRVTLVLTDGTSHHADFVLK